MPVSSTAWLVFAFVSVPLVGVLLWLLLDDSIVRIGSGELGLLMVRGRATDKALLPGPHFVPAFRRMTVQPYPSLELSYRARSQAGAESGSEGLEHVGPALRVLLGDRSIATVSYTLRFRLLPENLRLVHERFGPSGIWAAAQDVAEHAIRLAINQPEYDVDSTFGEARHALEASLATAVGASLHEAGFDLTLFGLGEVDLGATSEVVQATVRARLELEREAAEAIVRLARARNDADLHPFITDGGSDVAMRYRESEVWRDLVNALAGRVAVPASPARHAALSLSPTGPATVEVQPDAADDQVES